MRKITLLALAMTCFVGFGQNYKQLKGNYTPVAPKTESVTQKVSISDRMANSADKPAALNLYKPQTKAQMVAQAQLQADANRSASANAEMAKFNARTINGTSSSLNLLENKIVAQRGGFPAPYCGPLAFSSPEPITRVNVAGIDNVSPAATGVDAHQDFTAISGNVDPGTSYPIALEGNTDGGFTNRFVVFVDWNQNEVFTDAGETYEIAMTITGSTGTDGIQATGNIAVPADALAGATRMRVKKIFGTIDFLLPCTGATFGQAEDYSLVVSGTVAEFPAPYCGPLAFTSSVEPITRVLFAGIDNVSPAATGGDAHQDFTAIEGDVETGMSYPIALEGNTDGGFTNRFAVFVDWNQNDVLNDDGEVYEITMTIVGSTGEDGIQATGNIAVPADALTGSTRMRVKKIFGTADYLDPCLGAGFGSAEDYTLNVTGGTTGGGGDCDLAGTLEDPATSATTWTRPLQDGTCCSGVGVGVSYKIYGPFTVDAAGSYTFDLTTDGYDSFLFLYSTSFDPLDQEANYVAGNDDGPGGLTNSQIVTAVATSTEYFLVSTSFSPADFGDYAITITGPGAVTCGGGTGGTDNDMCADATAVTCGGTFAGDTSDNTDTGGFNTSKDEWFKFTGAGVAQNVTISLCAGTTYDSVLTVYSSCGGTQIVNNDDSCGLQSQLTFTSDGTSTYYIAVEGFGTGSGAFSLAVTCVDIVPPSGCGVANVGTFENGKSFTKNLGRIVAHDVVVQDGENFMLESINLNAFIGASGSGVNADNVDIFVWGDLGGAPDPGNLIGSFLDFTPTSQTVVGSAFGFDAWDVELDHPDVMLAGAEGSTTTYWVGISLEATDASNTFWENSTAGGIGFGEAYDDGLGGGFLVDPSLEGVYDIAGTCSDIGGGTGGPCDFSNTGTFENGKSFTQNLGRIVAHDVTVDADGFTLETINLNAFIGLAGSGVNAAFVDVYVYADAAGAPGALITSELGLIPTSQTVVGGNFGFDTWDVAIDVTDVPLTAAGTYWIGVSLEATDASNVFWENTTTNLVGFGEAYDDGLGGGFVVDGTLDGVYSFSGTCGGGGNTGGPCDTSNAGTFENGKSFTQNLGRIVAHDVVVDEGGFTLETINLNAFIGASGSGVNASFVDIYIYADAGGAPGAEVGSFLGFVPTSQTVVGSNFGFDVWDVELDHPDVPLTGVVGGTTYWIGIALEATDASNVFWENTTTSLLGLGEAYDDGLGGGFIVDGTLEGVYSFAGTCGTVGVTDNFFADFTFAPNPATDYLTLRSVNVIESATMYNLLGQKVMDVNINNTTSDLDVSALATGTYLMRVSIDGQIGTYKVIKK